MVKMYLDVVEFTIYDLRFTRLPTFGVRSSMFPSSVHNIFNLIKQYLTLINGKFAPSEPTQEKPSRDPLVNRISQFVVTASDAYLRLVTLISNTPRLHGGMTGNIFPPISRFTPGT